MSGGQRRPTIVDIASVVGVSRQTVTRAINDMPGINAETRARVLDAARELGYRPSRFGRGLVTRGHHTVGLMVDNLTNPYYPELAAAIVAQAAGLGWSVLLLDTSGVDDPRALLAALAPDVDVLVGYVKLSKSELDAILPGVPVVGIDVDVDVPDAAADRGGVQFLLEPGVRAAVDHLHAHGVRRPLMLDSARPGESSNRARLIEREWAMRGAPVRMLNVAVQGQGSGQGSAEDVIAEHLDLIRAADAIMSFNDLIAFGAMKALRRAGIRVPDDVRVVGIDGLAAGAFTAPELTTLGVEMAAVAAAAVSIARALLEGDATPGARRAQVGYRLIRRESA